jgi:hypothetical protein
MKEWPRARIDGAPIDLVLVGDLDVDAAAAAAAQTLGTLPKRREKNAYEAKRTPVHPQAGLRRDYEIDTEVRRRLVSCQFPTADGRDTATRRGGSASSRRCCRTAARRRAREDRRVLLALRERELERVYPDDGVIAIRCMADPGEGRRARRGVPPPSPTEWRRRG